MPSDPAKPMLWPLLQRSSREAAMGAPGSVAAPVPSKGGLKDEEREQIRADLIAAKYDPDVIEQTINDLDAQAGAPGLPGEDLIARPGPTATKTLVPMLLAGAGGSISRKLLGEAITRPLAAGLGEAAGAYTGMRVPDPIGPGASHEQAEKAALLAGGLGGTSEAGLNVLGARGLGRIAAVPDEAVEMALSKGPVGAAKITKWPFRAAPPRAAEDVLAQRLRGSMASEIPGMNQAEEAVARYPGKVEAQPIRTKLRSMMRKPIGRRGVMPGRLPTEAEETANAALQDAIDRLPGQFPTMQAMEDYLRRVREPVADQFGVPVKRLTSQDVKELSGFVRQYRDTLLGGEKAPGPAGFSAAHKRLKAVEAIKEKFEEPGGEQSIGAESQIRRAETNQELLRRIRTVDPKIADEIETLWAQREWTRPKSHMHLGRMMVRPLAKSSAVLARPVGQGTAMLTTLMQAMHAQEQP